MKTPSPGESYGQSYTAYQTRRSRLRQFIRRFYLARAASRISGPAIDYGCGAGDLLALLPEGSLGLEVNPYSVEYCLSRGLKAYPLEPGQLLENIPAVSASNANSLICSHVLEHLPDPAGALLQLSRSCRALGIGKLVVIVPGKKGFLHDPTHQVFIDEQYLEAKHLYALEGFEVVEKSYVPGNLANVGKFFTHHELMIVYERSH